MKKYFPIGEEASLFRSEIIKKKMISDIEIEIPKNVSTAVINVTDLCHEACPHCIYSAPSRKKLNTPISSLSEKDANHLGQILLESKVNQIVFSGGGEPTINLNAISSILNNVTCCTSLVIITSGAYMKKESQFKEFNSILEKYLNSNFKRDVIIRISIDNQHSTPIEIIGKKISETLNNLKFNKRINFVIRTLYEENNSKIEKLRKILKGNIKPSKFSMPVIDAFPTQWILFENYEIPIIYKPNYYNEDNQQSTISKLTSWKEIKKLEEENNSFFNLSLRGREGEGHNYYGTVLKGFSYWKKIGSPSTYYKNISQKEKELCLYIPSDARLLINAASPDAWLYIYEIDSWKTYLSILQNDPLQVCSLSMPTNYLIDNAESIGVFPQKVATKTNFVFSLARESMRTPSLRLYQTMKYIADIKEKSFEYLWGYNTSLIKESIEIDFEQKSLDPIIGNENSLWRNLNER